MMQQARHQFLQTLKIEKPGHEQCQPWIVQSGDSLRTSCICMQCEDVSLIAKGKMVLHARLHLHQTALIRTDMQRWNVLCSV